MQKTCTKGRLVLAHAPIESSCINCQLHAELQSSAISRLHELAHTLPAGHRL